MARKTASPESIERSEKFRSGVWRARWIGTFGLCVASVVVGVVLEVPQVIAVMTLASVPSGIITGKIVLGSVVKYQRMRITTHRVRTAAFSLLLVMGVGAVFLVAMNASAWQAGVLALAVFTCELLIGLELAMGRERTGED